MVLALGAVILGALAVAGILWLLSELRDLIVMVLLSVVITYLLKPAVDLMSRPRVMSRFTATFICFALLTAVIVGIVLLLSPSIAKDVEAAKVSYGLYREKVPLLVSRVERVYEGRVPPGLRRVVAERSTDLQREAAKKVQAVLGLTFRGLGFLVELLLVPILTFYFLSDLPSVKEALIFFIPVGYKEEVQRALRDVDVVFGKYLVGQLILCIVAFVVVTVGLWAMGMKFYLTLGIVAGVTRAIPIIGPIVGGIAIVGVALLTRGLEVAAWLLVAFILLHFLESKLLMPKVLGFQVGIHPVVIIIALLLGGELFGIIGMFLAVPVIAVVRRVIEHYRSVRGQAKPRGEPVAEEAAA
jgi:predicted PurR-regulated permease PerM